MPKTLLEIFFPEDYMLELTPETLAHFLKNLPTARKIEREAGLGQGHLAKLMNETRPFSEGTKAKLMPVLEKYHFK